MSVSGTDLLVRGDKAVLEHDLVELGRIAAMLSERIGDPLAGELVELVVDCHSRRRRVIDRWPALRRAIAHRISIAGT